MIDEATLTQHSSFLTHMMGKIVCWSHFNLMTPSFRCRRHDYHHQSMVTTWWTMQHPTTTTDHLGSTARMSRTTVWGNEMMGMPWDQDCIWEYTVNDVPGDIAQCSMTMEQHMLPADPEDKCWLGCPWRCRFANCIKIRAYLSHSERAEGQQCIRGKIEAVRNQHPLCKHVRVRVSCQIWARKFLWKFLWGLRPQTP